MQMKCTFSFKKEQWKWKTKQIVMCEVKFSQFQDFPGFSKMWSPLKNVLLKNSNIPDQRNVFIGTIGGQFLNDLANLR